MKIGVVGASGYAGGELLRLLSNHDHFDLTYISAGSNAGEEITSIHQHLSSFTGRRFEKTDVNLINNCDLVFLALPHGESASLISNISQNVKIVDLGADYRLADAKSWQNYYGGDHAGQFTYGLPEINNNAEKISKSAKVSNPGCYATAIILGSAPAVAAKNIEQSDLVVVAASGTTGAGRSAKINLIGSEVMNNLVSYKFGGVHQHTPEIEENLKLVNGSDVKLSFTPILAPMPRGILATVTAKLVGSLTTEEAYKIYSDYYAGAAFVNVLPIGVMPQTSSTLGTNNVLIQVAVDSHTSRLVVSVALDNLGKGAAGQAIQNANLMCGLPQDAGLKQMGVH